jgi:hypothetical protein
VRASALLAEADLRAGFAGADALLERCERDLRAAGLESEANAARAALFDARMGAGDLVRAEEAREGAARPPEVLLRAARLDIVMRAEKRAVATLRALALDAALPADLRAAAYAHLADAQLSLGRGSDARAAAGAAAALLEVSRRSRAHDARIHRLLARVFREVGDDARAAGHRAAARRGVRLLVKAGQSAPERRRIARVELADDRRLAGGLTPERLVDAGVRPPVSA